MLPAPPALEKYPGNKNIAHLYQTIINHIPPHRIYFEPFAGSAAVFRAKKPADYNILADLDSSVCDAWANHLPVHTELYNCTAVEILDIPTANNYQGFVYCDPPYRISCRHSQKKLYHMEMSDSDHIEFLSRAATVKGNCMISHYPDEMYDKALSGWSTVDIDVSYHGTLATERLYMNYSTPKQLHEYTYLGSDCWDSQRIKRKITREISKLDKLPVLERNAIISAIIKNFSGSYSQE